MISDDELIMHLKFDEMYGNNAYDSSPHGLNNKANLLNGTKFDLDVELGSVVKLDGENDYLGVKQSNDIDADIHAKRTVSLWFKIDGQASSNNKQIIYEEGDGTRGLNIYLESGKLYVGGWNRTESKWLGTFLSTDALTSNTWHHVALVLDGAEGVTTTQEDAFTAYLDGVKFGSGEGSQLWKHTNGIGIGGLNSRTRFHDGVVSGTGTHTFAGSIENFQIYNRAVTAEEIATLATQQPSSQPTPIEIGTNLNGISDWSTQFPFIDAFKSSRNWITQNNSVWDTGEQEKLDLDENGWVKSLPTDGTKYNQVGTLLFRGVNGVYPGGKYVVTYEGEGTIKYGFNAVKDIAASSPGRDVINVTPSNAGIYLKITSTDPNNTGNYIRDIRVIPEKYEATYSTETFNPDFIDKIQDFDAFRFMDWMKTNNSTQSEWSSRPTPATSTFSGIGAPVEIMVELANKTDTDPWFTMPHMATDEYITEFAEYVRNNLDPNLKVYVEYANEVWNTQFEQSSWILEQAKKTWPNSQLPGYTSPVGDNALRLNWFSQRTTQITQIWDDVFQNDSERVIGVMGAQASNSWTVEQALTYAWDPNPKSHDYYGIDAIAIAPYFGGYVGSPSNEAQLQSWTQDPDGGLNKLFDELTQGGLLSNSPSGGALQQAYENMAQYVALAESEGLQLLAYEGGQHLAGINGVKNNQAITNLFQQANQDERMGDLYTEYFKTWNQLGGGLIVNYNDIGVSDKHGSWSSLEHLSQAGSPKYDAVMDLLN